MSVIVITKNEGPTIGNCLRSIFDQSIKPLEVIVVDGGSTDDTVERAQLFPVKVVLETGQRSPSNARNLGVECAQGEIVLIMDADAELGADCIKNAMTHFQDPNVLLVMPFRVVRIHTRLEKIQSKWFYGTRSRFRTEVGTASAIQFIRKEVYNNIKYDPRVGFGDDSDFTRRLQKSYGAPETIIRTQDARILVNLPHTLSELSSQYTWYGRTSREYFGRYHSADALLRLGSLLLPTITLISCGLILVLPFLLFPTIFFLALIVIRDVVACIRSESPFFFEFVLFDFGRSLLFVFGVLQSIFVKRTGR